jgi:hypothetical protein
MARIVAISGAEAVVMSAEKDATDARTLVDDSPLVSQNQPLARYNKQSAMKNVPPYAMVDVMKPHGSSTTVCRATENAR